MFRRKQNQAEQQLIGVHPLGTQSLDDHHHSSQQSDGTNVTTVLTSRGKQQQGGAKFDEAKINPARRSQSLEGNLDTVRIDVGHVTGIVEGDKGKSLHSSHPHGLDVDNQQKRSGGVASFPVRGQRLWIIATPPSSSSSSSRNLSPPPPPAVSNSPTVAPVDDVIKTNVEIRAPYQSTYTQHTSDTAQPSNVKTHQQGVGVGVPHSSEIMAKGLISQGEDAFRMNSKLEEMKTSTPLTIPAGSGEKVASSEEVDGHPASHGQLPPKTSYPDPKADNDAFRTRTDTANSAMFDISYDL